MSRTLTELENRIVNPDLDLELYEAMKYTFIRREERVQKVLSARFADGPGSGLTGTFAEVIYSNPTVGTAKNTFTTEFAINDTAGMGPMPIIPAEFFMPSRSRGQAIRVVARGVQLGTASTPPTWLWTFRLNPVVTPAVPPTGPIIAGGAAATTGTTTASTLWEAEFDVQLTLEGAAGNNSTLRGLGFVTSPRGLASPFGQDLFGGAASPGTVATFDMSLINTLTVGITCGTSLAANQMQLLQLIVMGLN